MSRRVLLRASVLAGSLFLLTGLTPKLSTLMSAEPATGQAAAKKSLAIPIESLGMPKSSAEAKILKALAEPTEVDFVEEALKGVVDYLSDRHEITIVIDHRALDDASIGTDEPMTFQVSGISLGSALNLILRDLDLTWTIDSEVLLITTPDQAEDYLTTKTYDVGDLVVQKDENGRLYEDYDSLINTITSMVASNTWEGNTGGLGSIEGAGFGFAKVLVVRQTCRIHLDIARFLDAIRAIPTKSTGVPTDKAEATILEALATPTEVSFIEEPLEGVLNHLSDRHKIPIMLDRRALEDLYIGSHEPITRRMSGVSLCAALELILRDLDLTWTIDSEVLLITTSGVAEECMPVKVYDVAALVTYRDQDGQPWHDYDELINAVTATIDPASWGVHWTEGMGVGTFGHAKVFVLRQTWQVQLEVAQLLDTIRKISKTHATDDRPPVRILPQAAPAEAFLGIGDEKCGGKGTIGFF